MADHFLMKGKVWSEHKHKLQYPVAAEVKYDEIRLHVKRTNGKIEFLSYDGKPLHNLDSWSGLFLDVMTVKMIDNLDMGVLVNGNFNDSFRWCRTKTGYPVEKLDKKTGKISPALFPEMVEFYLFDIPDSRLPYFERVVERDLTARVLDKFGIKTNVPDCIRCNTESEVEVAFLKFRAAKKEGAMVKSLTHTYEIGKRIDGWLKMKPEEEADGKMIGYKEAVSEEGVPLGRVGSIIVQMEDESTAAPAGFDHDLATLIFNNPADYMGEWVTFNFMERDRSGGYRHPIFGRFRDRKD